MLSVLSVFLRKYVDNLYVLWLKYNLFGKLFENTVNSSDLGISKYSAVRLECQHVAFVKIDYRPLRI